MTQTTATAPEAFQATPSPKLVNHERAQAVMTDLALDAFIATTDKNLYYLSSHAPDSVLGHFWDQSAAALLPRREDIAPCLFISDYELAYLVTRPSWMPEVRCYGATDRSSAAFLLEQIERGVGLETELRAPIRALYKRTRPSLCETLVEALAAYVSSELGSGPVRVGFDDPRIAAAVQSRLGDRLQTVDALLPLRRVRMVKTADEIQIMRRAAEINDQALESAAGAMREGDAWAAMVRAYRACLSALDARPMGERGMMFGAGPDGGFVLANSYAERKRFRSGEAVVLDAICLYQLYHADMARTGIVGEPDPRQREIHDIVHDTLAEAEAKLSPGVDTGTVQAKSARYMRAHGLDPDLTTLTFHGIGLDVFEYAHPADGARGWTVESGTVLNFEVFHRDPEHGGIHLEDSVLVTDRGVEHFSRFPREMVLG